MNILSLKEYQKEAPDLPGVYSFKDKNDDFLYIGKAKSLRKRLASHINNPSTSGGNTLLEKTFIIEWIICEDEWQALILEQSMISKHQPKFNIKLRSGKKYPYIAISFDEEYPRVYLTRETRVKGRKYFGPYENKKALELLDILGRIFQYRTCSGTKPGRKSGSPCLDYSIKRCTAPCVDYIDKKEYRQSIHKIEEFLSGKWRKTLKLLHQNMLEASELQNYQQAAILRDRLHLLEDMVNKNQVKGLSPADNFDVVSSFQLYNQAKIQLLRIREGYIQESEVFDIEYFEQPSEIINHFLLQHYDADKSSNLLIVEESYDFIEDIAKFLSNKSGKSIKIKKASTIQTKNIISIAKRNASANLKKDLLNKNIGLEQELKPDLHSALVDLAGYLNINNQINRIECFDISNIGPKHTVGSMVVFEEDMKKEDYRRFKIDNIIQDDFASMKQMLERRVKAFYKKSDPSFSSLPDVIIIDGGKGQLSVALQALKDFVKLGVKVIALAKQEEEVFVANTKHPIIIPQHELSSLLLQRIRNEAHRFAITYHRKRRDKDMITSSLDNIEGIGKVRKSQLIKTFGSPKAVSQASQQDLEKIVPKNLAKKIYEYFNTN